MNQIPILHKQYMLPTETALKCSYAHKVIFDLSLRKKTFGLSMEMTTKICLHVTLYQMSGTINQNSIVIKLGHCPM